MHKAGNWLIKNSTQLPRGTKRDILSAYKIDTKNTKKIIKSRDTGNELIARNLFYPHALSKELTS